MARPSVWDTLFRRFTAPRRSDSHEDLKAEGLGEVEENQHRNPYTEILLVQHHDNIVRHVLRLGEERVATAGDDGRVVIWNTRTGTRTVGQDAHKKPVTALVEFVVGSQSCLASASVDHTVCLWDVVSGSLEHQAADARNSIKCLAPLHHCVTDHPSLLCAGGRDVMVFGPDLTLLARLERGESEEELRSLLPIKGGRVVASANMNDLLLFNVINVNGRVQLVNLAVMHTGHQEMVHCLVPLTDALFASGGLDGSLHLYSSQSCTRTNWSSQRPVHTKDMKQSLLALYCVSHITAAEHFIFVAIGNGFAVFDMNGDGGSPLVDVPRAHKSTVNRILILNRTLRFLTCGDDNAIRLWTFEDSLPKVDAIGYARPPTFDLALSRARDRGVQPTFIGEMLAHSDAVTSILELTNGAFVSCSADKMCIVWKNGDHEATMRSRNAAPDINPDGVHPF